MNSQMGQFGPMSNQLSGFGMSQAPTEKWAAPADLVDKLNERMADKGFPPIFKREMRLSEAVLYLAAFVALGSGWETYDDIDSIRTAIGVPRGEGSERECGVRGAILRLKHDASSIMRETMGWDAALSKMGLGCVMARYPAGIRDGTPRVVGICRRYDRETFTNGCDERVELGPDDLSAPNWFVLWEPVGGVLKRVEAA